MQDDLLPVIACRDPDGMKMGVARRAGAGGPRRRLVLGISGASGIGYGMRVLELARKAGVETHLVVAAAGQQARADERDLGVRDLDGMADVSYRPADIGAAIASGSFRTDGMIVAPCSIRTLSAIAYCNGDNLLTRAADVTLKERRRLVLLVRETPLTLGHLRAMSAATESGAVVMPPVPALYLATHTLHATIAPPARPPSHHPVPPPPLAASR